MEVGWPDSTVSDSVSVVDLFKSIAKISERFLLQLRNRSIHFTLEVNPTLRSPQETQYEINIKSRHNSGAPARTAPHFGTHSGTFSTPQRLNIASPRGVKNRLITRSLP